MPSRTKLLPACLALVTALFAETAGVPPKQDPWQNILSTVKLSPEFHAPVVPPPEAAALTPEQIDEKLKQGWFLILEGASPAADQFGFRLTDKQVEVRRVVDLREPKMPIFWEQPALVPIFQIPPEATVFVKEKWQNVPLVAGLRRHTGAVLFLAASPGVQGFERFPYLLHALRDLGLDPPISSRRLWAFFDSSYRLRADPEYLARRWKEMGIAGLHIAAWHFYDSDPNQDDWLRRLIGACHKNTILVYAWLELPHVSESFWAKHPEWREKTAIGSDAHLDWRKLMNLRNPDCAQAVRAGVDDLLRRFDWDGVNLAELYFESLEGHLNPARFTPMNPQVRAEFRESAGFDPAELFADGPRHWSRNEAGLRQFLNYRAALAKALQQEWIGVVELLRRDLPYLDLTLTHVDDLLLPETRDRIGADARQLLPLLDRHDFTFLVEDPATAWNLGPERYPRLAGHYTPLAPPGRVAIDINVVERYQDVYPTKQQVGLEMLREVHVAAASFSRVALYFESSLRRTDWPLLGAAAAGVSQLTRDESGFTYKAAHPFRLRWEGEARLDGAVWPALADGFVWLPAGEHRLESGTEAPAVKLTGINGELESAWMDGRALQFSYRSTARVMVTLNRPVQVLLIDGQQVRPNLWVFEDGDWVLVLPKGQHFISILAESGV